MCHHHQDKLHWAVSIRKRTQSFPCAPSSTTFFATELPRIGRGNGWAWNTSLHTPSVSPVWKSEAWTLRHTTAARATEEPQTRWVLVSGPFFSSLLHTDIGGNQNTAVRKKRVSTEVTLKRSNNLTAHQHSTCVWLNLNNSHRQGLLFLDTSPYVKISTS